MVVLFTFFGILILIKEMDTVVVDDLMSVILGDQSPSLVPEYLRI